MRTNERVVWGERWGKLFGHLSKAKSFGISTGVFIKAILKINNIANEIEKVCEIMGDLKLLDKIKKIPELTLKSLATNQSLYV